MLIPTKTEFLISKISNLVNCDYILKYNDHLCLYLLTALGDRWIELTKSRYEKKRSVCRSNSHPVLLQPFAVPTSLLMTLCIETSVYL